MAERLDAAYRATAARLPGNASVQIETAADGTAALSLSALDKLDEPASLMALRAAAAARMPRVDLPEILLEMHARTGFASEFTHASEGGARAGDLATSICAVLLAEACNTGLEPLIRLDTPALRRSRLSWVRQNYIRSDTLVRSNATLVSAQAIIPLARAWGGGEVASADGLRFVVPVRTIHSGPNPRYFGQERGVTYYNLTSDQFTGLGGIVVPGTLRDSLALLSVLLEQETALQPTEVMTDTGAYTDVMFGIFHLLGFQFSPRLADIRGTRFWRVDPKADYGALDGLARHRAKMPLVVQNWDDLLHLAGSLKLGTVQAAGLIRTLQTNDRPTRLARSLEEWGRVVKSLYLLSYIDDEAYRRRILVQLNRGESRHQLARAVFHGKRARRTAPTLPRRPGGPTRRPGPGGQRHRALEHNLHGRGIEPASRRGLRRAPGGRGPPVAARLRAHQHARPLRLHPARRRRARRTPAPAKPSRTRHRRRQDSPYIGFTLRCSPDPWR